MNFELRTMNRIMALILLLLVCPALVRGDELSFVPSLAVKEEYNSNIKLVTEDDPNNVRKDYITIVSPGLEITGRNARLDSLLSVRLDRLQYARNDALNATDLRSSGSVGFAATQRLRISAKAGYEKISNPSLDTGPANKKPSEIYWPPDPDPCVGCQSGDPGEPGDPPLARDSRISPRPTLPLVGVPVERITSGASLGYQLTEMTSLTAAYQYGWSSYETPRYQATSHDVQAGFSTDLGKHLPHVKGRLNAGYSYYILPDSRTNNVTATIGFSYDVNETWSLLVDGGLRRTQSALFVEEYVLYEEEGLSRLERHRRDNTAWGRVGHLSLIYQGEYTDVELGYTRDLTLASGLQAAAERNGLSLTTRYRVTAELSASLTAAYNTYRSDPAEDDVRIIKQNSISILPLVRYDLTKNLALDAGYERTRIDYEASDTKADRDEYFIRLSARFPLRSSSQYK